MSYDTCPHCGKEIETPPIQDITRPPFQREADVQDVKQDEAVYHIRTVYALWRKNCGEANPAFWSLPTTWEQRVIETYRQRGMEFIKLVTPEMLQQVKATSGKYWSWQMVEKYLDSDEFRMQARKPAAQASPEVSERMSRFNAWLQRTPTKQRQAIVDDARKTDREILSSKAYFEHWQQNVENNNE